MGGKFKAVAKTLLTRLDRIVFDNFVGRFFGNIPIFIKLVSGFLVLTGGVFAIGYISSGRIEFVADYIDRVYKEPMQSVNFSKTAQNDFITMDFLLYKSYIEETLDEDMLEEVNDSLELFEENLDVARERAIGEYSGEALDNIQSALGRWKIEKDALFEGGDNYDALSPISEEIQSNLADLSEFEVGAAYDFVIEAEKIAAQAQQDNFIFADIMGILSVLIAALMVKHLLPPIRRAAYVANSIAEGNMDNEIHTSRKDELGKLLQAMDKMQRDLVHNIEQTMKETRDKEEAKEREKRKEFLAQLSENMKHSVEDGLTKVQTTVENLDVIARELSAVAQDSSDHSNESSANIQKAGQNASAVAAAAEELSASISEINQQTTRSSSVSQDASTKARVANDAVTKLTTTSHEVGNVLDLINKIAAQINLLALNATIEAARAGDAGRGFAVVAGEVKSLANQTASATDEIKQRINNVQNVTGEVTGAIGEIMGSIDEVQSIVHSISSSISDQSSATNEISEMINGTSSITEEAVSKIVKVTESSATTKDSSEQVLEAAKVLAEEMRLLEETVADIAREIQNA